MAYETKVILQSLSQHCLRVSTSREVYNIVRSMANVEGVQLPSYDEAIKEIEEAGKKKD